MSVYFESPINSFRLLGLNTGNSMNFQPLILRDRQIPHTIFCIEALNRGHAFIDTSEMGCGKTVVWSYISLYYRLPVLVITTKNGGIPWEREQKKYGIHIVAIITYQSLRSVKGKQPKHGLLRRVDTRTEDGTNLVRFYPTEKLTSLCKSGILVVFDECQKIKNKSDQWHASRAISETVVGSALSRMGMLSGAPYDKETHVVNLMRMMSFIRHHRLFVQHQATNELELLGAQEMIDVCRRVDAERTQATVDTYQVNHRNVEGLCYRLFIDVLKLHIVSAMPAPEIDAVRTFHNGYYNLPEDEAQVLSEAIGDLSSATRFSETGGIDHREVNWGALTKSLRCIETGKVNLFVRLATQDLQRDHLCKILIFVNYSDPLAQIKLALDRFNPLVLDGKTSSKQRTRICELYRTDDTYRVLVANMEVGGASLDLQDVIGGRTRRIYMSTSSYKMLEYHQAIGRTHRDGSKSNTDIFFVYGKCARKETSIINALMRKGKVMRELLDEQVRAGVKFPDEYPEYVEEDTDEDIIMAPPTTPTRPANPNQVSILRIPQVVNVPTPNTPSPSRFRLRIVPSPART
jgi:hypothetical protein